jgi:hypothetical protein
MSSNRRTAFARVPRGKNTGTGQAVPATTQVNKQFLDRMVQARLAPDMATILTKVGGELAINIQANGTGNFSINSQGKVIGDSSDVQKVQSLGSFINDERKAIVKTSVSAMAKKTLAALVQTSREPAFADQVPRPIVRIDKSFVDVFRTINSQSDMLNANIKQITQLEAVGEANMRVRNHLLETAKRIRECFGRYLFYRASLADGEEAAKLNDYLIDGQVMSWIFTRLCSQKMQLGGKDFEYRKVYFPKDPTKGIQVTFRELKTTNLLGNQGGILVGMSVYRGLWSDDNVRNICGVPTDWVLDDFDGKAKVFANVPFMVVPFLNAVTLEEHFSVLAQNGDRGLAWSVGNTNTPQDTMRFLGTIPKRIAYGFFGRARFSAPWYETLFQGFTFEPRVSEREGRSVFIQLMNQFRSGNLRTDFFSIVRGDAGYAAARETLPPLVLAVMDIPPGGNLAVTTVTNFTNGMIAIPNGETQAIEDAWTSIITRREMTDEAANGLLAGILSVNLDPRSKDARTGDIRSARSGLSMQGSSLLREFKRRGYHALSSRVDQWMRSFLTTELQASVAEVLLARLEASLSTPIQFGKGDSATFIEVAEFDADSATNEELGTDAPDNDTVEDDGVNPDDN